MLVDDILIMDVNNYIRSHKKELNREVGDLIKKIRNEKNILTEQFASRLNVSQPYVVQLEKGDVGISLNKFILICNALEIEPKEILDQFLLHSKNNEDILYKELQEDKNISKNILEFIKNKK